MLLTLARDCGAARVLWNRRYEPALFNPTTQATRFDPQGTYVRECLGKGPAGLTLGSQGTGCAGFEGCAGNRPMQGMYMFFRTKYP
jgi:hypothetical protein